MPSVTVVPHSVEWSSLFSELRDELLGAFAPTSVVVEHIGSTSVPGLAAKPVIDVLLGASSLAEIESRIEPLSKLGYSYISKYESELPMRRYFVKSPFASLRVHVHAVQLTSRFWREHLAFRDLLRANPALRSEYETLKLRLAAEHAHDKSAYTAAKGIFIQSALSLAGVPNAG
jgi:GrpB-like predicted nucleotidyltransferase (UPF0157 family)